MLDIRRVPGDWTFFFRRQKDVLVNKEFMLLGEEGVLHWSDAIFPITYFVVAVSRCVDSSLLRLNRIYFIK